jgi:prophage DNA circulation protein
MADPNYAAIPQAFSFAGKKFSGRLESFSSQNQRRLALHEFLKRAGARAEDMERSPRKLDVRLLFIGDDCAKQYKDFVEFTEKNPTGLLVHPIAGKFNAFCTGPAEDVALGRAVNEIQVRVSFVESNIDAPKAARDIPSAPAAAQQVTAQQSKFEQATAAYMGAMSQAQAAKNNIQGLKDSAVAKIQAAIADIPSVADPIKEVRAAISTTVGTTSAAIGAVVAIQTQAELLSQDVDNFVDSSSDIFDGEDTPDGSSDNLDNLLGSVVARGQIVNDTYLAASASPAAAADALGATEELVASCYVLREALRQERPPTRLYTVPRTADVVSICVDLYPGGDALAQASIIMSYNRIPNPARVPKGTVLKVPTR